MSDDNGMNGMDDNTGTDDLLTYDELALILTAPELWASPSDDVEERVVAAIEAERTARAVVDPSGANVVDIRSARRRRWLAPAGAALVGAVAAALITVAVVATNDEGPSESADGTIVLEGSDLAPALVGDAAIRKEASGVRIRFQVHGLPRRDGGEFYQGWLKSCDSSELIPIGTFHELDDAIGWAGVDLESHPLLTITSESVAGPKDPAQGSSGEVVLSGAFAPCPGT